MKLKEVCAIFNRLLAQNDENSEVVITLAQQSIGGRAKVGIANIYAGFDWEQGQIRVEPEKPIMLKMADKGVQRPAVYAMEEGKVHYHCPVCTEIIHKRDRYCSHCGQSVKIPYVLKRSK